MSATVYGIGVGPGDPELITLKGARLLGECPVIAYPAPETGDSLARRIAAPHIPDGRTEIVIRTPMSLDRFPVQAVYDKAAEDISGHITGGRDVAVLCEGDPFFYGSFMYLFSRLAEHGPVEVVPGVSSLTACAAALGSPLAARNDVFTVIPAGIELAAIGRRVGMSDSVAIIKVGRHLKKVRDVLRAEGLADGARYIERATMGEQRILPLEEVPGDEAPYFSMILAHRRGDAWE